MRIGRAAGVTDTGRRRLRNEDAFICEPPLFAVADGMGGARAGEVAARLAAGVLEEAGVETKGEQGVTAMIIEANRRIWERALADPATAGMGTTVTAALVDTDSGAVAIGHVGDSRAYLRRGRTLTQLTTDHSIVGQMIASGQLTPEEGRSYEHSNVLLQALGVQPVIQPELLVVSLRAGDVVLLCSDGLTGPLEDPRILELMLKYQDPVRCCRALTEAACAAGGPDNVTVAVGRFVGEGLQIPQGREPVGIRRSAHTLQ